MAKSSDKGHLDGTGAAGGTQSDVTAALPETRIFQDGPQTMLLDPSGLDEVALERGALDHAVETAETAERLVSLTLEDLLPDAAGEVVLVADDDLPINLLSNELVTEAGIAPAHVTASGMEVTGLHYYSFESGLTVYSPVDLLILSDPSGA